MSEMQKGSTETIEFEEGLNEEVLEHRPTGLLQMMTVAMKDRPNLVNEDEYEYEDNSSATATPEPGSKKPGKPNLNPLQSKPPPEDITSSNQLVLGTEEKGKSKKIGKIAIEEVDSVSPTECKSVMPSVSSSDVIEVTQVITDRVPIQEQACEKSENILNYDEAPSLNIQQAEHQQASPKKKKKKGKKKKKK
jgi:hypothetical protein